MTWEYRVMHEEKEWMGAPHHVYSIIEAYYREGTEEVELWSHPEDTHPSGETVIELADDLNLMRDALAKPVLERKDLPGGH